MPTCVRKLLSPMASRRRSCLEMFLQIEFAGAQLGKCRGPLFGEQAPRGNVVTRAVHGFHDHQNTVQKGQYRELSFMGIAEYHGGVVTRADSGDLQFGTELVGPKP